MDAFSPDKQYEHILDEKNIMNNWSHFFVDYASMGLLQRNISVRETIKEIIEK